MLALMLTLLSSLTGFSAELKGVAKSLDGKKILYLESHRITLDGEGHNKVIESQYMRPDGVVFARMTSDFSNNKTVPEIVFDDLRFKKREELSFLKDGKTILLKKNVDGKFEQKTFPIEQSMVVGQGFDNFIKINFKKLTEDSVAIFFGVVTKLDFFNFTAQKRSLAQERVTFGLNINNRFFRLFLSELKVEYDTKSKQLVKYVGLSNLPDDSGRDQNVLIDYEKMVP